MKFPLFASFIVFIIWFTFQLARRNQLDAAAEKEFWIKEHRANRTPKKSLEDLAYITIPFERLPMQLLSEDERVAEYQNTLRALNDNKIVNFTGITNTDLKLKYGAPNIDLLMRYDQNYTILVRTLNQWASYLYEKGYPAQARDILEFAISTGSDISGSYKLLCKIYKEENTPEKIQELYPVAQSLQSAMKNTIVRILQESAL